MKKLLTTHPLQVEIKIKIQPKSENFVQTTFLYLSELQVVSVKTKLILDQECKSFSGDREVMQAHSLLGKFILSPLGGQNGQNVCFGCELVSADAKMDQKGLGIKRDRKGRKRPKRI